MWTVGDFRTIKGMFAKNWDDAMRWVSEANTNSYAGYNDWKLASIAEYRTIRKPSWRKIFSSNQEDYYWARNEITKYVASYIDFNDGFATSGDKNHKEPNSMTGEPFKFSARLVRSIEKNQ